MFNIQSLGARISASLGIARSITPGFHRYKLNCAHCIPTMCRRELSLYIYIVRLHTRSFPRGFKQVEYPNRLHNSGTRRFEPSSRTFLIGEQPNAWDLLQPRAKVSRHRGAEHRRRYGRLGGTSLFNLSYTKQSFGYYGMAND